MSNIKNWVIENIVNDSNIDLEFREMLAGFNEACDKIEEAIDNTLNGWTKEKAELEEHKCHFYDQEYFNDDDYQMEVDNCLSHGENYR